jgi:hypothetical protein
MGGKCHAVLKRSPGLIGQIRIQRLGLTPFVIGKWVGDQVHQLSPQRDDICCRRRRLPDAAKEAAPQGLGIALFFEIGVLVINTLKARTNMAQYSLSNLLGSADSRKTGSHPFEGRG